MEKHELMIRIMIFLIEQAQQRSVFDQRTTIYDLDRDDNDDDSMDEERGTGDIDEYGKLSDIEDNWFLTLFYFH